MLKSTKKWILVSLVITVLIISSMTVLLCLGEKESIRSEYFVIEYDSTSTVRVSDGRLEGIFDITTRESESSVSFSLRLYQESLSTYSDQNLSFFMESECILGNGRYFVNQTMSFEFATSNDNKMWEMKELNPPGILVLNHSLSNSTSIYSPSTNNKQLVIILWELNLTSTIVPKEDYECMLSVQFSITERNNGISTGASISIITFSWVIGIIVLIDSTKRIK
ncbi:MAG: hypothetical protein P1Q69_03505 [Candidatus Thorarchaeota archaeon]|nr:hypothetical protein [Candidatus Thorarchaeota archaeon]